MQAGTICSMLDRFLTNPPLFTSAVEVWDCTVDYPVFLVRRKSTTSTDSAISFIFSSTATPTHFSVTCDPIEIYVSHCVLPPRGTVLPTFIGATEVEAVHRFWYVCSTESCIIFAHECRAPLTCSQCLLRSWAFYWDDNLTKSFNGNKVDDYSLKSSLQDTWISC